MGYLEQYWPLIDKLMNVFGAKIFAPVYENDNAKVMMWLKQFDEFVTSEVMEALSTWSSMSNERAEKTADLILSDICGAYDSDINDTLAWIIKNKIKEHLM